MEKQEALARITKLNNNENNILIAVLPKTLYCEICHQHHPYDTVQYLPQYNLNACLSCRIKIARIERYLEIEQ